MTQPTLPRYSSKGRGLHIPLTFSGSPSTMTICLQLLNSRPIQTHWLPSCSGRPPRARAIVRQAADGGSGSSSSAATPAASATPNPISPEQRFHEAYAQAYTMSQLYVKNRPEAVPLQEWEVRRKKRDMEDILEAARRRGKDQAAVRQSLEQLEVLMPGLVDLNKMKPADWVSLSEDVSGAANKLVLLKSQFPTADIFSVVALRPKMLLQSAAQISDNAAKVKSMLADAADSIDAIIQAVPELSDPVVLSRSLAFLATSFPGQVPVALLRENPKLLLNLGESNMEDFAEYGEMTTKD